MNRSLFIRYTALTIELILCTVIQSLPWLRLELFGGSAILLLPAVITLSVFEGEIPAIIFGVAGGLLADSGYSGAMGYYAIMLAIICYISSILMENYIRTNLLTTMIIGAISIPVIILGHFLFFYILAGYGNVWYYFISHYLSRIIYTIAFLPVFYGINRFIAARTSEA